MLQEFSVQCWIYLLDVTPTRDRSYIQTVQGYNVAICFSYKLDIPLTAYKRRVAAPMLVLDR